MGKSTQDKIVSVRAFAERIGVSEGAVRKAISKWQFTTGVREDGKIDTTVAVNDPWVKKQLVIRPKPGVSRSKAITKLESPVQSTPAPPSSDNDDQVNDTDDTNADEDVANSIKVHKGLKAAEAMRRREIVALALDKKKLQELQGILIRKDVVEKALFLLGSELKKAMLDIPARCVRDIMAANTEVEGIKILEDEIIHVLSTYGNLKENTL